MKSKFPYSDLYNFLRTPAEDREISYSEFLNFTERVRSKLLELETSGKIKLSEQIRGDLDMAVRHGIKHLGLYHAKRPLIIKNEARVNSENLSLLLFYRNRLDGYDLQKVN
jgi:glycerol-3-phosphate O-acyltransferase